MSPFINPYNFFPLPAKVQRENVTTIPGWRSWGGSLYSGWLEVEIITLTRLILPSQLPQHQITQKVWITQKGERHLKDHITLTKFQEDPQGRKIIPGTSWKGPVRAVMEALSDSCLSSDKVLPGKKPKIYQACTPPDLCPCCRLFGAAGGEGQEEEDSPYTAMQGRLVFSDALLTEESQEHISEEVITLKELSSPKLKHKPFYFDQNNLPLGRKFYLHQRENRAHYEEDSQKVERLTHRNRSIGESVLPGARFLGKLQFTNLTQEEMGLLLWGLELDEVAVSSEQAKNQNLPAGFLAHKLGLGKPLGLGSVKIRVTNLALSSSENRYKAFTWPGSSTVSPPEPPKQLTHKLLNLKNYFSPDPFRGREQLRSLLTFPYPLITDSLAIHYPSNAWFKRQCPKLELPPKGVLPDSCPDLAPPSSSPKSPRPPKALTSRRPTPSSKPSMTPPARTIEKVVEVKRLEGPRAVVEFDGQELTLVLPPYVAVSPGQRLKVKINKTADGRLKPEFKKRL